MRTNNKVLLGALAGAALGIAGARAIGAQQPKTPPAYVIAEIEVTNPDPAAMEKYRTKAPEILAAYHGRYVVRRGKTQALEGEAPKGYIVVIGFDSAEKAREWYDSPAYQAIKPIRQNATKSRLFIAEGVAPE